MDDIVTVHRIAAEPVAEAEEERDILAGKDTNDVLARGVHPGRRAAGVEKEVAVAPAGKPRSARQDLVLLEMDVDGVGPLREAIARIAENPVLDAVLGDLKADDVAVKELIVDYPLAVVGHIERKVARHPRINVGAR